MDEIRILTPCGAIGYGFPEASIDAALLQNPHVIAVDAGSTDPGPYYLGADEVALSWQAQKRDLEILMRARHQANIPLIVGSAGLGGARSGVTKTVQIIREIAQEHGHDVKIASIYADFDKPTLKQAVQAGKVQQFEHPDPLTAAVIDKSTNIVGQMGMEPIIEALEGGADVVIAGRAYDPAMFAALPILRGFDPGLAIHMGKILECGSQAAEPSTATDAMMATMRADHFVVEPINPDLRCTVDSVAVHTMYEKESPVELYLPGGMIDLRDTVFEAISDRAVKVSGTVFKPADTYTVKLEGAALVGYRSLFISGTRDPIFIQQTDEIIKAVRAKVAAGVAHKPEDYQLIYHVYGKNGVMGANECVTEITSHEIGIVCEIVAKTQAIAHEICSFAHGALLHYSYPGRKAIAGNLAFPHSPSDFDVGPVFEFSIYHLLEVESATAAFPITYDAVKNKDLEDA